MKYNIETLLWFQYLIIVILLPNVFARQSPHQ